jgi:uncharacterized protein (DUF4415 family)
MNKRIIVRNTPAEEAAIQRGIAVDADTFEPTESEMAQMKRRGRPRSERPKVAVTVRYDAEVIERFRASGEGWQTRMNDVLLEWLNTHPA